MPYQGTGRMPVRIHTKEAKPVLATVRFGLRQSQLMAGLACVIVGLSLPAAVLSQDADAGVEPESEQDGEEAPQFIVPEEPTRPYLDAIDRIEAEYGPYSTELSDLYLGLGEEYLKDGDYKNARDAYHRGVMVVRVNSGPNSPDQTNLLYLIANIETIMEEPGAADKILENIEFINTQYYGENSPELIPVYERMYEWYMASRPLDLDESDFDDYRKMIGLTESMVDVSDAVYGPENPESAIAYRRFAEANFQALRFTTNEEPWVDPRIIVGSDTPYQTTLGYSDLSPREHYLDGRKAYLRYLELVQADPSKTQLDYAEAIAELGDWNLLFGKYRAARKNYEEAYGVLASSSEYADLVDSYLGQPKPMHFSRVAPGPVEGAPLEPDARSIDISMTVTRIGDVRYVEFLNPPEEMTEDEQKDIMKMLQETPFRPSLKDGKAVTTEGFIWQHVYRPEPQESPEAPETILAEERTS
jgi:tetratricopeptide (TPR) repeat protein